MWRFRQRVNVELAKRVAKETNDKYLLKQSESAFQVFRADSKDLPYMNGDPEKDNHQGEMIKRNKERGLNSKFIRRNAPPDVAFEDEDVKVVEQEMFTLDMKRDKKDELTKKFKESTKKKYLKAGYFNPQGYDEDIRKMNQNKAARQQKEKNANINFGDDFKA